MCRPPPICSPAGWRARWLAGSSGAAPRWLCCGSPRSVRFTANYVAAPLTETLVLTTIALAFYGFARWQDAGAWLQPLAVGCLRGAGLLHPAAAGSGSACGGDCACDVVAIDLRRARQQTAFAAASPVLAMALCAVLPLAPWTLRNWRTFHVFQPLAPRYANDPGELPPLGFARWYRTWAIDFASTEEVYWNYNGDLIDVTDLPHARLPRRFAASRCRPPRAHRRAARRLQPHHHRHTGDRRPLRGTGNRAHSRAPAPLLPRLACGAHDGHDAAPARGDDAHPGRMVERRSPPRKDGRSPQPTPLSTSPTLCSPLPALSHGAAALGFRSMEKDSARWRSQWPPACSCAQLCC